MRSVVQPPPNTDTTPSFATKTEQINRLEGAIGEGQDIAIMNAATITTTPSALPFNTHRQQQHRGDGEIHGAAIAQLRKSTAYFKEAAEKMYSEDDIRGAQTLSVPHLMHGNPMHNTSNAAPYHPPPPPFPPPHSALHGGGGGASRRQNDYQSDAYKAALKLTKRVRKQNKRQQRRNEERLRNQGYNSGGGGIAVVITVNGRPVTTTTALPEGLNISNETRNHQQHRHRHHHHQGGSIRDAAGADLNPECAILVAGLPPLATNSTIRGYFMKLCGPVPRVSILKRPISGQQSDLAWVSLRSEVAAQRALRLNDSMLMNSKIAVFPKESDEARAAVVAMNEASMEAALGPYHDPYAAATAAMQWFGGGGGYGEQCGGWGGGGEEYGGGGEEVEEDEKEEVDVDAIRQSYKYVRIAQEQQQQQQQGHEEVVVKMEER